MQNGTEKSNTLKQLKNTQIFLPVTTYQTHHLDHLQKLENK